MSNRRAGISPLAGAHLLLLPNLPARGLLVAADGTACLGRGQAIVPGRPDVANLLPRLAGTLANSRRPRYSLAALRARARHLADLASELGRVLATLTTGEPGGVASAGFVASNLAVGAFSVAGNCAVLNLFLLLTGAHVGQHG